MTTDTQKLQVATDALKRGYESLTSSAMAQTKDGEAAWKAMGDALAILAAPSTEQAAPAGDAVEILQVYRPGNGWHDVGVNEYIGTTSNNRRRLYAEPPAATERAATQPAGSSVDVDAFWDKVTAYIKGSGSEGRTLVEWVNAWGAQQREAGRRENLNAMGLGALADKLSRERAEAAEKERDDVQALLAGGAEPELPVPNENPRFWTKP